MESSENRKWKVRKIVNERYKGLKHQILCCYCLRRKRGAMPSDLLPAGEYLPRVVDARVEEYLSIFGAVEIAGTKWCGKTWTACAHGSSITYVDRILPLVKSDPGTALAGDRPHVIDEWQRAPLVWNEVRHAVDAQRKLRGAWVLTGSSTPFLKSDAEAEALHSGAGRIGRIRMYPMSLAESGDSSGAVSVAGLFEGRFAPAAVPGDAASLASLACRGGWPEALDLTATQAQIVAREYLELVFSEGVARYGKSGQTARRIALSLARNVGQSATYQTIIDDISAGDEPLVAANTLASYLQLLKDLYFIEEVPGWVPPRRSPKRLAVKPKRYFADPSIASALIGVDEKSLLEDWQTFGLVFENMFIRDLSVYAGALPGASATPVRYYRDDSGLEVDAVVELSDGRWAAFECKLGSASADKGVASLLRLRKKLEANPKARTRPPEFMAVITGTGEYAYKAEEGVYVIPLRALGA